MRLLTADCVSRSLTAASLTVPKRSSAISASMPDNIFQILLCLSPIIRFYFGSSDPILHHGFDFAMRQRRGPRKEETHAAATASFRDRFPRVAMDRPRSLPAG